MRLYENFLSSVCFKIFAMIKYTCIRLHHHILILKILYLYSKSKRVTKRIVLDLSISVVIEAKGTKEQ